MAKSTAAAALASLSHKYHAKIREVGSLKAFIKRATQNEAEGIAKDEAVRKLANEIKRLQLRNDNLSNELLQTEKSLRMHEFDAGQARAAYTRVQAHTRDVDVAVKALKGDVANWKSLAVVLFVVGVAVGTLGALGYVTKVAGIY